MKLLTEEIKRKIPPLYSQENVKDPIVHVKFFTPWTNWTWYATEFDGEDIFFGWVVGMEKELGYFSLSEMESVRGPGGLRIERDMYFDPKPLSEVMAEHGEKWLMTQVRPPLKTSQKGPLYPHAPKSREPLYPHTIKAQGQRMPAVKRPEYEIEMDRMGCITITRTDDPDKDVFLQFEADKELIYGLLRKGEQRELENGWTITVRGTEPRASTLDELWEISAQVIPMTLLASTVGDPKGRPSKFCCRLCGECTSAELLGEGRFLERISWLRQHYKEKHPGQWGKQTATVMTQTHPLNINVGDQVKSRVWMEGNNYPWLTVIGGPYRTSWAGQPMNEYKVTNGLTENNVFEDTIFDHKTRKQSLPQTEPRIEKGREYWNKVNATQKKIMERLEATRVLEVHSDGDLTIEAKGKAYVVTTAGSVFVAVPQRMGGDGGREYLPLLEFVNEPLPPEAE